MAKWHRNRTVNFPSHRAWCNVMYMPALVMCPGIGDHGNRYDSNRNLFIVFLLCEFPLCKWENSHAISYLITASNSGPSTVLACILKSTIWVGIHSSTVITYVYVMVLYVFTFYVNFELIEMLSFIASLTSPLINWTLCIMLTLYL